MLPLGAMNDVHGLYWHLRPCWYPWSVLLPRTMLVSLILLLLGAMWMLMARVTTEGQVEVMLMSMGHATTRSHIDVYGLGCPDVCGPCYNWWSWGCLWSALPPKTMLMSLAHPANWNHVSPWSMLPVTIKRKFHLQWYWCLQTNSWE